jgi:hypothetical protein
MQLKLLEPSKPNPSAELECVSRAASELLAAIRDTSPQARQHLDIHPSPSPGDDRQPMTIERLANALHQFEHDNRFAFRLATEDAAIGCPEKPQDEWVIWQLWTAWQLAHGGGRAQRGWQLFRAVCTDPLIKFGLLARSDRASHDVLAKARARAKLEEKAR